MDFNDFKQQLEDSFNIFFGLVEGKMSNNSHIKPSEYMDFLQQALPSLIQASMQAPRDFIDIKIKEKDLELKDKDLELREKDLEIKEKDLELKDKQIELLQKQIDSFKAKSVADLLKIQVDGWSRYASAVGITEDNLLSVLNGKNTEEVYREYACLSGLDKMYTVDDNGNTQEEDIDHTICQDNN